MILFQSDLEEQYQKLQVDNVRVEAELKHEKQKVEMLQRDLVDSQKVSYNTNTTNINIENSIWYSGMPASNRK